MDLNLKGKVVAITGGNSGIGLAAALGFAREGCKVAICGRSQAKLDAAKEKFAAEGFELFTDSIDVTKKEGLEKFVADVAAEYGQLNVFINNAGSQCRKPAYEFTEEDFYKVIDTDLKSVFFGCVAAAEQMKREGHGGTIINTTSFTAAIPTSGISVYSAAKAGAEAFTKVFACEYAADGIRVLSLQPGMTMTDINRENCIKNHDGLVSSIAMKRLATPEDYVNGYLFLASDAVPYMDGATLQINGAKFATQNPHYAYRAKGELW